MRLYGFSNRYHRFRNLSGFALSEDVRLVDVLRELERADRISWFISRPIEG